MKQTPRASEREEVRASLFVHIHLDLLIKSSWRVVPDSLGSLYEASFDESDRSGYNV